MTFTFIDAVFLLIVVVSAVSATVKGFIHEFFGKLAFVLGVFLAIVFTPKLTPFLTPYITIETIATVAAFVIIFVLSYLVVRLIQQAIKNVFSGDVMKGLDHSLGALFGVVEGIVFVSLILLVLDTQPWFNVSGLLGGSFFYNFLRPVILAPADYVRGMVAHV